MPKGVEHRGLSMFSPQREIVFHSLMPKGVEHRELNKFINDNWRPCFIR